MIRKLFAEASLGVSLARKANGPDAGGGCGSMPATGGEVLDFNGDLRASGMVRLDRQRVEIHGVSDRQIEKACAVGVSAHTTTQVGHAGLAS
jgi:hypothetical protein